MQDFAVTRAEGMKEEPRARTLPARLALIAVMLGCAAMLPAPRVYGQFDRPYRQWTAEEVDKLLSNSAWAQTQAGLVEVGRLDPLTAAANTTITIRLRSALPIRQALARLRQLRNKYDKRSEIEKAAIDERNKPVLECSECADYYMVVMSPGPGSKGGVPTNLQTMSFTLVKDNVQIKNEKGETRELVKFVRPRFYEDDAVFFFPRFNPKGEPLISPAHRTLTISFDPRIFAWKTARLTKFDFDVAKMIVNGQVVF
jgi:hypothetical protein